MHRFCRRVNGTPDGIAADLQRWRNSSEMPQRFEFPGKVPVFWKAVLCFQPYIVSQCSYLILALVHCGAVRTISKDLNIPCPSSRDYEYLEDYLHCQMKEWVCSHASERLLNDRCENRIKSYRETGSLPVEKSLSGFYIRVQIMCSKGSLPQHRGRWFCFENCLSSLLRPRRTS